MKKSVKFLSCILAIMTLLLCFAACGGNGDETTAPSNVEEETETGRDSIKDTVPTDLNFGGEDVTFFVRDNLELWKNEMDVEKTTNDTLYDAIYYRNVTVEERLGIEIKQISQAGHHNEQTTWNQTLRNAVLTKSGDFDTAAIYQAFGAALAFEGIYYNVLDLPHINLDQPWWNQNMRKELTLFDNLYFLSGDITVTQSAYAVGTFFNKNLFEEFYSTQNVDLYDMVRKGEWTIDEMYNLVAGVWVDNNSNGVIDNEDTIGFSGAEKGAGLMDQWIPALGIKITNISDGYPELAVYDEHTVSAFEKMKKLYTENPGTLLKEGLNTTSFRAGNQLFSVAEINAGADFRSMDDDYGVLPMPKYDKEQEKYQTRFLTSSSIVTVLSTCENPAKIGATLELMGAESYKQVTPAYYEICLKGKYSDAPEDAEMYDKILEGIYFDFGFCYGVSIGNISTIFRDYRGDIAQKWESNKISYQTQLDDVITALDDISFAMGG